MARRVIEGQIGMFDAGMGRAEEGTATRTSSVSARSAEPPSPKGKAFGDDAVAEYEMTLGGCGPCVCKKCLLWWSGRCPRGGCWDEWRAVHEPWPGPVRRQWSAWNKPGEQAHWCRGGACYSTLACPDYIEYEADKAIVQHCLEGAVVKYQDGYIQCSMIDVMGCEECYRRFEARTEGD